MTATAPSGRNVAQLALPLGWDSDDDSGGFLVGTSNVEAVRHLEHHATWPVRASVLVGPAGSGKSLLGRAFAQATGGAVIDPVEGTPDHAIFHAWNAAQETRKPLLLIASAPPASWPVALPDLRSRLMAAPVVTIGEPDDCLALTLIERQFAARATPVAPDLAGYLVPRIERSYSAIHRVVRALDEAALAGHRRIGIRTAREVLFAHDLLGTARRRTKDTP